MWAVGPSRASGLDSSRIAHRNGRVHRSAEAADFRARPVFFRELAGIAQQIEQNLLEPRGVRVERAQILLGFDNEAVLVLLGELSRGVIDVTRFTYWAQQIADVFRKYVTRQTGKARRAPQQFDPTAQDVGKRRASMHPWAAGMLFSAPDARVE